MTTTLADEPVQVRWAGSGVLTQVQVLTGRSLWSGAGLATDLKNGALARFRTLPISMTSVLVARSLFDLVRSAVCSSPCWPSPPPSCTATRRRGLAGTAAALLIGLSVGAGLSWVFLALASWVRNVELMQMLGFVVIFPLMFASSAFVPVAGLPGWLQVIATVNPLTYAIDAARGWALADPALGSTVGAVFAAALLTGVAGALAARGVRRP